jgi:hypothetical protein
MLIKETILLFCILRLLIYRTVPMRNIGIVFCLQTLGIMN